MTRIAALGDLYTTLSHLAVERRDEVALVSPRGRLTTFGGLNQAVMAAATRLRAEGMCPGDAVAFAVRPSVEAIVLVLATVRAGGTIVTVDPGMGSDLFAARMTAVQPKFVMAESVLYTLSSSRVARRLLRSRHLELPEVGHLTHCRFVRVGRWLPGTPHSIGASQLMLPLRSTPDPPVGLHGDHPVLIVFTSGTTAAPKAVVHTARSVAATLDAAHLVADLGAEAVVVTDQLHSVLPALLAGARVVLPRAGARPGDTVDLLHRSLATHAFAVPSDVLRMVTYCERNSRTFPGTLRELVLGAGPAGRPFLARLCAVLPRTTRVRSAYGLTEMAPVASVDMVDKLAWQGDGDLVGTPLPGATVRIGEAGELKVGGTRLCARYLGETALSEVATGDLARLDDAGRIVLLGRSKDMIIRGQFNIYPSLYEEKIEQIPGIARCALVGIWDESLGDERVVLVAEPTWREFDSTKLRRRVERALWLEALIDNLSLPDDIVFMDLPESGRSHKIDRNALRRKLAGTPP